MGLNKRLLFAVWMILSALLSPPGVSVSAGDASQTSPPPLSDLEELETFVDGLVAAQISAFHVPGVTISIVQDGQLVFAKGYGYADVEQRIPVQADRTLFRPGSVSKLFTWTAVMQLVEQGKLDLDGDVNTYLDFQIPATYPEPVTLRHLLTHTPGFEDQGLGLFSRTADDLLPLGEHLAAHVPGRVFPPGDISAYSNYGAGLAGYIVERVAGQPFEAYVESNIFQPLGMSHSTFRQPLPPDLAPDMSKGYHYAGGRYEEGTFEFVQPAPAGALSATASDLAAFMIAHLQNGRYESDPNGDIQAGETRILQEETARQMHTLQFANDERLPGWGQGFSVAEVNGLSTFGHGGDTIYFHSDMLLLPDENVGVFISTNSDQGIWMRLDFIQRFIERYYPVEEGETPQPPADFQDRAARYAGTYFPARMSFSGVEKTLNLVQPVNVQATPDGELRVTGLLGPAPTYWVEQEPMVFASVSDNLPAGTLLVFKAGGTPGEEAQYAFFFDGAYIRQPWYGSNGFHLALLGVSLALFLAAVIAYPIRGLVRRHYRKAALQAVPPASLGADSLGAGSLRESSLGESPLRDSSLGERLALWTGWGFALLSLLFWVFFTTLMSDINSLVFGLPPAVDALMIIPYVLAVLAAGMLVFAVLAWVKRYWSLGGRIFYTLLALAAAAHVWFLSYWNLL